uniref:Major facilitator superfamily (MFS) profile domain-containing protein n=2 Tax=Clastoptera arizonana TaxID=38151 RepID=A0A1B6E1Y5_9HEMI
MQNFPWTVVSEILPSSIKAKTSAIGASLAFFWAFLSTISFPDFVEALGADVTFWIYSCFSFAAMAFIHIYIPETKNLTLNEIQNVIKNIKEENNDTEKVQQDFISQFTISFLKRKYENSDCIDGVYRGSEKL